MSAIPEKSSDEGAQEDEMTRVIKDTVDHVIQHDKEELSNLLMELRNEVGKEYLDTILDLKLLAGKFLIDEFQEGEPLLQSQMVPARFDIFLKSRYRTYCKSLNTLYPSARAKVS